MKHKLLLAVDGRAVTWKCAAYVGRACAGGSASDQQIVIFHVLPPLPPSVEAGESSAAGDLRERFEAVANEVAEKLLLAVREWLRQEGVSDDCVAAEFVAHEGDVAAQILDGARRHHCDTIVVGRPGHSMIGEFFKGSVVEHLLRKPVGFTVWVVE